MDRLTSPGPVVGCAPGFPRARAALRSALARLLAFALLAALAGTPAPAESGTPLNIAAADPAAPAGLIKWHPGHYVLCAYDQPASSVERYLDHPQIQGAKVRYRWRDLEPHEGVYDFSRIEADLAVARRHGKRIFLTVMDRTWGLRADGPRERLPAPDYIMTDPLFLGGVASGPGAGRVQYAMVWHPPVMDRLCALTRELGRRFDGVAEFEGICTDETAATLPANQHAPFTTETRLAAWKRWSATLAESFPRSTKLLFLNWFPQADELATHCARLGVGFGAPDVVPLTKDRQPKSLSTGERGADPFRGRVPIGHDVQAPDWGENFGRPTAQQILAHAVDRLKCNYVFWLPRQGTFFADEILPALAAENGRIVADPPAGVPPPAAHREK